MINNWCIISKTYLLKNIKLLNGNLLQILSDKFLIAFGPCRHGKYKDTTYQDTYVHDIVDYEDAKRHTILAADRVLAPWEADGERFSPGIVIDGHEKRQAPG